MPVRCPSCDSPDPRMHPATQAEGEVTTICPDPFHSVRESLTPELPKFPDVHVQLTGRDGNAFAVIGAVTGALRRSGHADEIEAFTREAMSGDYDHLLQTAMVWVDVS